MTSEARVPTRMADGTFVRLTRSEIKADLVAGSEAAVKRAKVPPLPDDELEHLLDIYASFTQQNESIPEECSTDDVAQV